MSGRKENLKKSLGITEYPWSSDDEENGNPQLAQDMNLVRRQTGEPRSSVADMPGTSGLQPPPASPASVRKQQAKMDRTLFWSIINNTPKPSSIGAIRSTNRVRDIPPLTPTGLHVAGSSATPPSVLRGRSDRAPNADIQRILAFKKLTRSLDSLSQNKPASGLYSMSSRGNSGPSRSPLFTPSLSSSELALAAASARVNRAHSNYRRQITRRGHAAPYPTYSYRHLHERPAPASGSLRASRRTLATPADACATSFGPELYGSLDQSDEEPVELPDQPTEPRDETNADCGNAEVSGHNSSAGGVSLEEEIVVVEPAEEGSIPPPPLAPLSMSAPIHVVEDSEQVTANDDASAVPANMENADASPSQSHGVKRKREVNDERGEQHSSVKEFNQSLLRLLECPVCLEWMEPPISQCRRGHLVCARCRARLASCPVCRTTFSSVRNRAMEGVAEMLRYPCRHGCGREVRLRRRAAHESSCGARRYHCPASACAAAHPLLRQHLADHFQSKHLSILKIGRKQKFSMKVNSEQHDTWLIMALDEFFHLRVDVDIRTWGVDVYVAYIGPKCNANSFVYEVAVEGQHSARRLVYARTVHSDLESPSLNVSRQDCFHLTLDQALNFLRFKNRHCESDKFLDFNVEITKCETNEAANNDSDS